jgi:hypothetical protein
LNHIATDQRTLESSGPSINSPFSSIPPAFYHYFFTTVISLHTSIITRALDSQAWSLPDKTHSTKPGRGENRIAKDRATATQILRRSGCIADQEATRAKAKGFADLSNQGRAKCLTENERTRHREATEEERVKYYQELKRADPNNNEPSRNDNIVQPRVEQRRLKFQEEQHLLELTKLQDEKRKLEGEKRKLHEERKYRASRSQLSREEQNL